MSPYHYGYNNPVITIDPDGKENIVVIGNDSGKGYKSRLYMKHFVAGAIKRAKTLRKQSLKSHSKEKTTLIMFAQKGQDVSKYVKAASDAGFELQIMSEDKELVEYINNGEQKTDENGKVIKENNRKGDEISNLAFFGHGGQTAPLDNYNSSGTGGDSAFDEDFIDNLNKNAFRKGATIDINACFCGANTDEGFVKKLSKKLPQVSAHGSIETTYWGNKGIGTYNYESGSASYSKGELLKKHNNNPRTPVYYRSRAAKLLDLRQKGQHIRRLKQRQK